MGDSTAAHTEKQTHSAVIDSCMSEGWKVGSLVCATHSQERAQQCMCTSAAKNKKKKKSKTALWQMDGGFDWLPHPASSLVTGFRQNYLYLQRLCTHSHKSCHQSVCLSEHMRRCNWKWMLIAEQKCFILFFAVMKSCIRFFVWLQKDK